MKKILTGLLSFIFILGLAGVCSAEEAVAPKLSFGGDIRIRGQILDNNKDLNSKVYDNEQYFRHRTRLWLKGELEEGYTAYVRLAIEPRWGHQDTAYTDATMDTSTPPKSAPEWTNHLIIDNSYIEAKNFLGTPVTLKLGRQDLSYGEGFLINEGTAVDGTRTYYFDAIKLSAAFGDTSADLFTAKVDEGAFSSQPQDDEDLYGLYITNKSLKDHTIEVYGLQREQRSIGTVVSPLKQNSTTAIGARSTGKVIENLSYAVELAKEFGKYDKAVTDQDRNAIGGLANLTYAMPQAPTQPSIKLGAYYTSGNKTGTKDKNEGWDCFYSEFSKYGYGDILSNISKNVAKEEGVWTNHMIYELDIKTTPLPKMTTSLGFLYVMANTTPTADTSKIRGRCPQAKLEYQFTQAVSGHVLGQYFLPGDYYAGDDKAFFGRAEMAIKF